MHLAAHLERIFRADLASRRVDGRVGRVFPQACNTKERDKPFEYGVERRKNHVTGSDLLVRLVVVACRGNRVWVEQRYERGES